jgi:hypothetical protein
MKKCIEINWFMGLNAFIYGQKARFKEKALCREQIVISYLDMFGT